MFCTKYYYQYVKQECIAKSKRSKIVDILYIDNLYIDLF